MGQRRHRVSRREILVAGGLAAAGLAALPRSARAQAGLRRVGLLMGGRGEADPEGQARLAVVRRGLRDLGWEEGRNLQLELRWAAGDRAQIDGHAADLVRLAPEVILANSTPAVDALAKLTRTIPIVFAQIVDPVGLGYVASLARPGGNITGFTFVDLELVAKWPEVLKEAAPSVTRAALLFNPESTPFYYEFVRSVSARGPGPVALSAAAVKSVAEIEPAIAEVAREPGGGLIVPPNPFLGTHRTLVAALAQKHKLPSISVYRNYVDEGGLMSYGPDSLDIFRRATAYVDRILKGARPADLPVQAPAKYELVVNLKAAKAIGLDMSPSLVARADEVVE
jgi:putative tryptophan/tyrosine transport system substrate-binding protein